MGMGGGHGVQLPAIHRYNHRAGLLRLSGQPLQRAVGVAVGNENFINGTPAFQSFRQGVASLKLPLRFRNRGIGKAVPASSGGAASVIHRIQLRFLVPGERLLPPQRNHNIDYYIRIPRKCTPLFLAPPPVEEFHLDFIG